MFISILVIVFIVLLFSLLVILHEFGHFLAARRGGVDVDEFGIGFPPYAWGKKIGKTIYTINWLPLGGFVRMKGEDGEDTGPHTFGGASYPRKAFILLAGVGMNLLTAIVILFVLCLTGLPALGASFEPGFIKPSYTQPKQLILSEVVKGSPADTAGIKKGDYLTAANGQPINVDTALRDFTKQHAGEQVTLSIKSGNTERDVQVKLRAANSKDGYLGVGSQQVYKIRYSPIDAVIAAFYITGALFWATIVGVIQLLIHIPNLLLGLFQKAVPAAAESASGPLGIIFILKSLSSLGFSYIFLFMANIAVALAAFNVLPLPALDGGRLFLITVQKVTKRKIAPETEAKIHAIGFMCLIALMVVISVYDLRKYF